MILSTLDIYRELNNDIWSKDNFLGVFPINKKPKIKTYPSSLVLNNQKHNEIGQHWIAIYFLNKNKCEFFDSFGNHPDFYKITKYLQKYSKNICYLNYPLQHIESTYCGYYCLYFIMLRSRKINFHNIVKLFKKNNQKDNDNKIKNLLN
jgi:hypothetical protein